MSNKQSQNPLRWLIAAGSVVGFLGGWMILGNAAEINTASPAPLRATTTTSAPASTQNNSATTTNATVNQNTLQPLTTQATTNNTTGRIRMRTAGS